MNWYDDPGALAAKLTALAGALVALVSVAVDLATGGGFDAEGLTGALAGLITAAVGVVAELAARRRAIAPATVERALRADVAARPGKPDTPAELLQVAAAAR